MIDRDRPPKNRKGWRWEYREGCQGECSAASCPWFGNCKGEDTPHWLEVRTMSTLREIHGDDDCHICGKPKAGAGMDICSYPHGMVPAEPVDGAEGMWTWKMPDAILEQ